jgi:hypothetical protein
MNRYLELKAKHQKEVNDFPMFFAFNREQFEEGMRQLGLEPNNTGAIIKLGSTGGYLRKTDESDFSGMMIKHDAEVKAAIDSDPAADGFIFDMFSYELANHEYACTGDVTDALCAPGLSKADINASAKLQHGLRKSIQSLYENSNQ